MALVLTFPYITICPFGCFWFCSLASDCSCKRKTFANRHREVYYTVGLYHGEADEG